MRKMNISRKISGMLLSGLLFLLSSAGWAQITVPPPRPRTPVATTREELVQRDQATYFAGCDQTPPGSVLNGTGNPGGGTSGVTPAGSGGLRRGAVPAGVGQ